MSSGGLVIGLGGSGVRVALRLRQMLASSGQARVPDSIRLMAFDIQKPAPATGRLPQSYSFLVQLPPREDLPSAPLPPARRQAARNVLLDDLTQGAASSLTLRGLAAQLDALRRVRVDEVDVFLVCSSFGETGTAWLLDMAYLVRHLTQNRMKTRIHVVALVPEAFERTFFPSETQRMTNFVFLRELEALQRERSWEDGFSIYGGKYIGSLPGLLHARPFDSVQVLDAVEMNTSPEAGAIPAAAHGILSQLDSQVAGTLSELPSRTQPKGANVFSTFGTFSLVYPTRLVLEQAVQRLLIGAIEQILPLEKDPDSGRPTHLAEPGHQRPDDIYGRLDVWIHNPERSGVLQDVLRELVSPELRGVFRQDLARRSPAQWQTLFYRCSGAEPPTSDKGSTPETYMPLVQAHIHQYLEAVSERLTQPEARLGAPLEYLQQLQQATAAYLQDLDDVVEGWRQSGEHSDNPDLRRTLGDSRKEVDQKRSSLLGRIMPQAAQDAQNRYSQTRQQYQLYRQREAIVAACLQTAEMLLVLNQRLLQFTLRVLQALALQPSSVYNTALDQSQRLEREARFETAVRSQQLVVDQGFENSQAGLVFNEFSRKFNDVIINQLRAVEKNIDWESDEQHLPFMLADSNLGGEPVDLDDPNLPPDQLAALLNRYLSNMFTEALLGAQPDNTVINFLSYLDPRADRLAGRMAANSAPLAKLITPTPARRNIFFTPRPNSPAGSNYSQTLLDELHQQLGEVHVYQREDADRLSLFRYFDGIGLDNLMTFHQSAPRSPNPDELNNYILWDL